MATLDAQFGTSATPIEVTTDLFWDNSTRVFGGPRKMTAHQAIYRHPTISWDITSQSRNTWNIFRSYYDTGFRVSGENHAYANIGDYLDVRYNDDASRIANEALFQQEYLDDLDLFNSHGKSATFLQWLQWRHIYGTVFYGNLPEFEKFQHVGYCWAPCPYSTQSSNERTRIMLGLNPADPLPTRNDHSSGGIVYYMKPNRRQAWGFECTFENCPGKSGNIPYFYA